MPMSSISALHSIADGTIVAWDYEAWSPTRGGRPGGDAPGNVVTGLLAGFEPPPFTPRTPAPRPRRRSTTAPTRRRRTWPGCVRTGAAARASMKSERVLIAHRRVAVFHRSAAVAGAAAEHVRARVLHGRDRGARQGGPGRVSAAAPERPRLSEVVAPRASAAGWEARPSPRPDIRPTGVDNRPRHRAACCYEGDNGYCAIVAEVEVNQDTGHSAVQALVVAKDSGPISNPDGIRNQVEGGALQGVSRALVEEVTWNAER